MNKTKNKMPLNQKIINSKFNITKNFLYFLIVPAVIILVGIILLCTLGFNLGTDFTGASTFKVYVNDEDKLGEEIVSYNLDNKDDYNVIREKIEVVLEDNGLSIREYRTTSISITNYLIENGQAVEVVYQNTVDDIELIEAQNNDIRSSLITAFGYADVQEAISSVDFIPSYGSYNWAIGVVAGIVFASIIAICYMAFRYDMSAFIVGLIQVALDIFLTISLILVCRITINLSMGIILFSTLILTIVNLFHFYSTIKNNIKSGKLANLKNNDIANTTVKEITMSRILVYVILLTIAILFSALAVEGVREVSLGTLLSIVTTFYTSEFILPGLWATCYKKKTKKINKNS